MTDMSKCVEIIPGRFFWASVGEMPRGQADTHWFSTDRELVYEPFNADFGPLNLGCTVRFCNLLENKMRDPKLAQKKLIYFSSNSPALRANSACLAAIAQVILFGKNPEEAVAPFKSVSPPFQPYRDATAGGCSYRMTIYDAVAGVYEAMKLGFFDYQKFDLPTYEFYEKVEHGDLNWIVPNKFLAFAGPSPSRIDADGFPVLTPEDYVAIFRRFGISVVVRLNKKQYDRRRFTDHGIHHVDLYFLDGSCPSREIINNFFKVAEMSREGALAIHCKAGLGRTGTLIGLYCMKHFKFPARAFIGWNRVCRPGSILGPQQQFLCEMEPEMFALNAKLQTMSAANGTSEPMSGEFESLSVKGKTRELVVSGSKYAKEDVGQGERLCSAKRNGTVRSFFTRGK